MCFAERSVRASGARESFGFNKANDLIQQTVQDALHEVRANSYLLLICDSEKLQDESFSQT